MDSEIKQLREKFSNLDTTQTIIEKASDEFIKACRNNNGIIEDLIKLWKHFCINKTNKLPYIYLVNDIVQKSNFNKYEIHDKFFKEIVDTFVQIYFNISLKTRESILRTIDIWIERNIFDLGQLAELKTLLVSKGQVPDNMEFDENSIFLNLIKQGKVKINSNLLDFSENIYKFQKFNEKQRKLQEQINTTVSKQIDNTSETNSNQTIKTEEEQNKNNKIEDLKTELIRVESNENRAAEDLLKNCLELAKKQNQVFFKHIFYLQEIDKMIDRINSYKAISKMEVEN
jgi:hypothetical protein